jgi:hypothetical protein
MIQEVRAKTATFEQALALYDALTTDAGKLRSMFEVGVRMNPADKAAMKGRVDEVHRQGSAAEEFVLGMAGKGTIDEARATFRELSIALAHVEDLQERIAQARQISAVVSESGTATTPEDERAFAGHQEHLAKIERQLGVAAGRLFELAEAIEIGPISAIDRIHLIKEA